MEENNPMDPKRFTPRDEKNVKAEHTGERTSEYSRWHRTLGDKYLTVDIDFVEYRHGKGIVALVAVTGKLKDERHITNSKRYIWQRTAVEREILISLAAGVKCPAYYVIHNEGLTVFHVHNLANDLAIYEVMNQEEYAKFIKNL